MADDYEGLQQEIATYLGREDLTALIPDFIRFAEAAMNRDLRLKSMEREAYTRTQPGEAIVALPDKRRVGDWDVFLEMRDIRVNGAKLYTLDYIAPGRRPLSKTTGLPSAYTIRGRELELVPAPDTEYELIMIYYAEIPPLGEEQPGNAVLLRAPDLYLYGALLASVPYARSSAPMDMWNAFYERARQSLSASDAHGRHTPALSMNPIRSV